MNFVDYFYENIEIDPDSSCWNWTGRRMYGYGIVSWSGTQIGAHRASAMMFVGDPSSKCVCHKCDNRKCVNPKHLFLGSRRDNMHDARRKGRHPFSKLTESQALRVIDMLSNGVTQRRIAGLFGVSQAAISKINRGESWGDLR